MTENNEINDHGMMGENISHFSFTFLITHFSFKRI
jgi:hypothetical protein